MTVHILHVFRNGYTEIPYFIYGISVYPLPLLYPFVLFLCSLTLTSISLVLYTLVYNPLLVCLTCCSYQKRNSVGDCHCHGQPSIFQARGIPHIARRRGLCTCQSLTVRSALHRRMPLRFLPRRPLLAKIYRSPVLIVMNCSYA